MPDERHVDAITHAVFQTALNRDDMTSVARRAARRDARRGLLWPGLISPRWATAAAFRYAVGHPTSDQVYVVDRGYVFDGASVPWPLTLFTPKTHSSYLAAAALHDWLYEHEHDRVSRERADAIFREAMIVLGTSWIWAGLMWRAVRAAGWTAWWRRKPDSFACRFLRLPLVVRALPTAIIIVARGLAGALFVDLWSLGRYRAQRDEIERYDRPNDHGP